MANCAAFNPTGAYVSQVVSFVDCHSLALGVEGYQALGPGTAFGMALSWLLTIYVAVIGYRLLLGGQITIREGVFSAIRLGFVLALATQWAAYQPLVYDVAVGGPADLASRVLAPGGIGGGASSALIDRVQGVHAALGVLIEQLAPQAPASVVAAPVPTAGAPAVAAAAAAAAATPAAAPMTEAQTALLSADRLLVGAALAGTLSVRVITALLLALGPLFIACMLFDATRGLFVGWVRVLAGATLAGVAAALVIALELAVIEPQVLALRDLVDSKQPTGQLPQDMLATCGAFAVIMVAALIALTRTTAAFRLPASVQRQAAQVLSSRERESAAAPVVAPARAALAERGERSRAEQIAEAARASERRDGRPGAAIASTVASIAPRTPAAARLEEAVLAPLPLGQSGRRTARRVSPTAGRRDTLHDSGHDSGRDSGRREATP